MIGGLAWRVRMQQLEATAAAAKVALLKTVMPSDRSVSLCFRSVVPDGQVLGVRLRPCTDSTEFNDWMSTQFTLQPRPLDQETVHGAGHRALSMSNDRLAFGAENSRKIR